MIMETILSLVGLMISASLVNNVVLSQFLGLCPFLGVSKKTDTALGMGGACIFVITLASLVCSIIEILEFYSKLLPLHRETKMD